MLDEFATLTGMPRQLPNGAVSFLGGIRTRPWCPLTGPRWSASETRHNRRKFQTPSNRSGALAPSSTSRVAGEDGVIASGERVAEVEG
jgi:hypothetical protein